MPLTWGGGIVLSQMPHRLRLWRGVQSLTHDRDRRSPTHRDVYGVDIPCRLQPDMQMLMGTPQGMRGPQPGSCVLPARDSRGQRIRIYGNDIIEIKWTRQDGNSRRIVETTLTTNAAADTTALNVANTWGFEPEELVVLENAAVTSWHVGLVESVSGDIVNLRAAFAVPTGESFASGDTVKVAWTARVLGQRDPLSADLFHTLSIQKANDGEWLLK